MTSLKPNIRYPRTFGCDAYGFVPPEKRDKLDPRARKAIFIGYGDHQKGYLLYDPKTGHSYISRTVTFDENNFGGRTPDEAMSHPKERETDLDPDYLEFQEPSIQDDNQTKTLDNSTPLLDRNGFGSRLNA